MLTDRNRLLGGKSKLYRLLERCLSERRFVHSFWFFCCLSSGSYTPRPFDTKTNLQFLLFLMSDADSMLDALMRDTTSVSFAALAEGAPRPPLPRPSTSARMGGGVSGEFEGMLQGMTRKISKLYSVASVNREDSSVCFGVVGAGYASFCVRKGCNVRSHVERKVSFQGQRASYVFICRDGTSNAIMFSEPCVNEERVPTEVRREWNTRTGTLAEWVTAFQAVDNADNAEATLEDIKEEAFLLTKAERFRTPLKKIKEEDIEWEDDTLGELVFAMHARTLPVDNTPQLEEQIAGKTMEKGLLTRAVARLETSVVTQGEFCRR